MCVFLLYITRLYIYITSIVVQELKTHPAFMDEIDPSQPLSAATEGMMAMKYESDDLVGV